MPASTGDPAPDTPPPRRLPMPQRLLLVIAAAITANLLLVPPHIGVWVLPLLILAALAVSAHQVRGDLRRHRDTGSLN